MVSNARSPAPAQRRDLSRWYAAALVLAALSMTAEAAHVLELPQKLHYDAAFYSAVNGTLYRYFAIIVAIQDARPLDRLDEEEEWMYGSTARG